MTAAATLGPVALPLPPGWEQVESSEDVVIVAAPERPDQVFRPNIVMTSAVTSDALHVVSARAIAAVLALHTRSQVLSVELDDLAAPEGVPSRTIEWSYAAERSTILVRQWVAVVGGQEVHVTGSCAVEEFEQFVPFFRAVLAGATVRAEVGAPTLGATGLDAPDDETARPRIDAVASARVGSELEALDGIVAAQPRPVGRWLLSDEAVQDLFTLRGRGIVSRARRRSTPGRALAEAGLTNALGALADDGQRIAAFLERADHRYGAVADHGGRSVDWSMWLLGTEALVRARGTVADLVDGRLRDEPVAQYDIVPAGRAVGHLLTWARVSPAWALSSDEDLVLPTSVLDDRVARPGVPDGAPPFTGLVGDRLWQEPTWFRLRGWGDRTPSGVDVVAAGAAGWFRRDGAGDDRVALEPTPSGSVVRGILRVFADPAVPREQ